MEPRLPSAMTLRCEPLPMALKLRLVTVFSSLVRNLAVALDVRYALVTRLSEDGSRFKTLALWERDHLRENVELPLRVLPARACFMEKVPTIQRSCAPDSPTMTCWRNGKRRVIAACRCSMPAAEYSVT